MKKQEAENKALEIDSTRKMVFCPLSGIPCSILCETYEKSSVQYYGQITADEEPITEERDWNVTKGHCVCFMLHGSKR